MSPPGRAAVRPSGSANARAVSTVLDATLCLLLVSASVLTLTATPAAVAEEKQATADTADETAETLATSTARVSYRTDGGRTRTAHDTLAGLLASTVRADARPASASSTPGFVEAVTEEVGRALGRPEVGVQVVARSTGGTSSGEAPLVAGGTPPPDADVHAASLAVRRVRLTVRTWER